MAKTNVFFPLMSKKNTFETHLSQAVIMILKSAAHFVIQEEADVKVGSNKVPSPLKLSSGGLMRVVDVEVNELGHS